MGDPLQHTFSTAGKRINEETESRRRTFCSKETVVEIQVPDHRANIEGTTNRVQLVVSSGDPRSYMRGQTLFLSNGIDTQDAPFGTMVPSTTGPKSLEHPSKRNPSRPQPMVSMRQRRAVSNATSEVT